MRIAFFVPKCTPDNSHGRYVIELSKRLADEHEVTIYAGAFSHEVRSVTHCHFLPVPNRPTIARLAALWAASRFVPLQRRFDIVHTQGADAPVGNVVTAQFCNAAMSHARGPRPTPLRRFNALVGARAEEYCMRKLSTRAVIAISESVKHDIMRYYRVDSSRVAVVPHGVDAEAFHPRNRDRWRERTRQRVGLDREDFVVVFVGGDYQRKGFVVLLEAIRVAGAGIRLLAVGVRPDPELAAAAAGQVSFVDPTPDVTSYYAAADCFALPTRYDTFSLATLEAMASGLPVIVSRAAGVSEHLTNDVDALILEDPGDVHTLAAHLRRLAADQGLGVRLGAAGRRTAERLSWERVVDRTLEVYRQAIGAPR